RRGGWRDYDTSPHPVDPRRQDRANLECLRWPHARCRRIAAAALRAPAQPALSYWPQAIVSRNASYFPVSQFRETTTAVLPLLSVQSEVILPPNSTGWLTGTGSRSGNSYARTVSGVAPSLLLDTRTCDPEPQLVLVLAMSLPQPGQESVCTLTPSTSRTCPSIPVSTQRTYFSLGIGAAE